MIKILGKLLYKLGLPFCEHCGKHKSKVLKYRAKDVTPHLSNKSELKKEAVREFMEFCWDGGEHDGWIIAKADEYFSSNEKEEGEKQ